ncbi:MAG: nucleoside 2-deoxyribosyltransferase [Variovorax sp.]|nr:MAG: nucleoside 2-deoxyribosyltransferase [Variovorax sp.]
MSQRSPLDPRRPRVYLAGPDVFFRNSEAIFGRLMACCNTLGIEGVPPSDGGISADLRFSDEERAQRIYDGNIRLIREADGVVANLVPFRGHEPDSGTVFEVGYATALGKPVIAYGVAPGTYAERVCAALACDSDASGVIRERVSGVMVEGLGQRLNLMLTRSTRIAESAEAALASLAGVLLRDQRGSA